MPDSTSAYSRVPSHLKWLLNERAMLCGEISRHRRSVQALEARMATLRSRVSALDETMALFAPSLNPAAAGSVHASAGKYGVFGGLTAFVREQLEAATDNGVDTVTLMERAAVRFAVDLRLPGARKRFKDTVAWSLRHLQRSGAIEVAKDSRGGRRPKVWRAAGKAALRDLAAQETTRNGSGTHAS